MKDAMLRCFWMPRTRAGRFSMFFLLVSALHSTSVWASGELQNPSGVPTPRPNWLSEGLFTIRILGIELWQWTALGLLLVLSVLAAWIVTGTLHRLANRIAAQTDSDLDNRLVESGVKPVRFVVWLALFYLGALVLGISGLVMDFLDSAGLILAVLGVTWLLLRMTNVVSEVMEDRLKAKEDKAVLALLPMGRRVVKVVIWGLAFLGVVQNLGFDITGLVAGVGVGGIAIALAAQKTVENLFGGATLLVDQPIRVGDYCKFGSMAGTVEDVGLRSTRVRTLDRTLITVPNSEFSQTQIENFGARDRIRLYVILGFRYETTPDQFRYLLSELRALLWSHPKIDKNTVRVRFVGFGAYSLDVEVAAYVPTSDWNEFLAIREDIFLRIMDITKQSGSSFAFPSQTSYLCRDGGLDEKASRKAENEVDLWRKEGKLPFPVLPSEKIDELENTLDYPPAGSYTEKAGASAEMESK